MYALSTVFVALGWIATLFAPSLPLRKTFDTDPDLGTEIGAAEGQEAVDGERDPQPSHERR